MSDSFKDFGIITINDFIDNNKCLSIISEFESLDVIPDEYGTKEDNLVKIIVNPKMKTMNDVFYNIIEKTKSLYLKDLYIAEFRISSYKPGYSMWLHRDEVNHKEPFCASAVLYLNSDFTGGDIVFPNRKIIHSPKIGDLIIFDSNNPKNDHEVLITNSGIRYVSAIWMTDNPNEKITL